MCLFTIIVPTYNSAKTIDNCLRSVTGQVFDDFEIIVIDGLSTDGTQDVVKKYMKDSPVIMVSEKDNGIYDAMNKGIKHAKGKWLYFLGSDDELYQPEILSGVKRVIAQHGGSRFIYGDVVTTQNTVERYKNYAFTDLLSRCICHQSIFYHKSLFEGRLYDTQYKVCADWDFNLKIFRNSIRPVYMDKVVARFNLGGVSGKWMQHPEYLNYFADKKQLINRYRGNSYLYTYYYPYRALQTIKNRLVWMFQS